LDIDAVVADRNAAIRTHQGQFPARVADRDRSVKLDGRRILQAHAPVDIDGAIEHRPPGVHDTVPVLVTLIPAGP